MVAYLDLETLDLNFAMARRSAGEAIGHPLSGVEREAVMLARSDPASSLHRPARLRKIVSQLFGLRPLNGLADPRLEGLRRFAVAVVRDNDVSVSRERDRLRRLGYVEAQIDRAYVMAARYRAPRRASQTWVTVLPGAIGVLTGMWLANSYFDDMLVSFMTATIIALPILVLAARR